MAGSAVAERGETTQTTSPPSLSLIAEYGHVLDQTEPATATFIDADKIPELNFIRRRAAQNAADILQQRRRQVIEHELEGPAIYPIDALGTAKKVEAIASKHGADSPEHKRAQEGHLLDTERLLEEGIVNLTWGYFEEVPQYLDETGQNYLAHGMSTREMNLNALSPLAEPEDRERRGHEYVEEEVYHAIPRINNLPQKLGALGLTELVEKPGTVMVVKLSPCSQLAKDAYKRDQERIAQGLPVSQNGYGGMAPQIDKFKIRMARFDATTGTRYLSEFALPGLYITDEVQQDVLARRANAKGDVPQTRMDMLSKEWLTSSEDEVFEFVQDLDEEASRRSGKPIYLGEVVSKDFDRNYDPEYIKAEARSRQKKLQEQATELNDFVLELQKNQTDSDLAGSLIQNKVKSMLLKVVEKDPDLAEHIFDKQTAVGFRKVAALKSAGLYQEAYRLQQDVEKNAPAVGYCGAGSCGLEDLKETAGEAVVARKLGAKGRLIKDRLRSCPGCKTKSIVYGLKKDKVSKVCTSCGNSEIDGKRSRGNINEIRANARYN